MQTSKLISIFLLVAAAIASATRASASDSDYPGVQAKPNYSALTRAQVHTEYLQAKSEGKLQLINDNYPVFAADEPVKTRAEVKRELAEAKRDGYSVRIDNGYPATEAGS